MRIGKPLWKVRIPESSQPSSSFALEAVVLRNGQVPNIVEDEAIARIVSREPVGRVEI